MKSLAITLGSLALVACGGGGGGGSTAPATTTTSSTTAALSSTNQTVVAQDAASSALMVLSGSQSVTGAQATDESVLFSLTRTELGKLPQYLADAKANATLAGAVASKTYSCSVSGTVTLSVTDADNNGVVSAGDSITLSGSSCQDSTGTTNGSYTFAFNSLTGSFGVAPSSFSVTVTYNALTFTSASGLFSASLNGSLSLSETFTGTNLYSDTISTPSLTSSATYSGQTRTRTLSSYSATSTRLPDTTTTAGYLHSYTVAGTLTSSALSSQSVTFSTPKALVTYGTDAYPTSGSFLVIGANNTQVKLTALTNTQVSQELDANGDGAFETSSTVLWNTIL